MPVFEFETNGRTVEIDAPDEGAAVSAFQQFGMPSVSADSQIQADPRSDLERNAEERVRKERAENRGVMQTVDDTIRRVVRGPLGPWMDEIAAGGNAAVHSLTGGYFGEPYAEGKAYQQAYDRALDDESTKVGELPVIGDVTVGGLTKLASAVATAPLLPVARVFGGGSLLARSGNAMATGAGYGAALGAGEGEGGERVGNAMLGGMIGGVAGGVMPSMAAGAGNAYNAVAAARRQLPAELSQFGRGAVARVSRAAQDDGIPTNYMRHARELGPEGMLADMGQNLMDQASGIATKPGAGSRVIREALGNRRSGAAARIDADVDRTLGPARNLVQLEQNVVGQARTQAGPHYEQFYQTRIPVTQELHGVLQRVPQRVMAKAQELADLDPNYARFASQTGEPNGMVYDLIKRAADDLARAAGRGTNEERLFSALSRDLRNAVDGALSPGQPQASPWAVARSIAGDGMQFREGLEQGGQAFSRGTHPDQMAADLAGMGHVQRVGFNEGARGQIRDIMGNAATSQGENAAAAARRALGSENARRKIAMVADQPRHPSTASGPVHGNPRNGQKQADRLIRRLDAETRFQNTSNDVLANSRTASRQAAQKEFPSTDGTVASDIGKRSASGLAMEGVYRIANALVGGAINSNRVRVAEDAARMLIAQGADRDAIVRGLLQYATRRRLTGQRAQAVESVVNSLLVGGRQRGVDSLLGP